MSFWTDVRDSAESIATFGIVNHKRDKAERDQRRMVNEQIGAYREQTNLAKQQLDEARNQTQMEKRRVEEKQIRSLRRNYRAQGAGMLGVGDPGSQDMNSKLGG